MRPRRGHRSVELAADRRRLRVLLVGDVFAPCDRVAGLVVLLDGDVHYEAARRRAVPVVLAGLEEHAVREAAATGMYGRLDPALARALAARLRPLAPSPEASRSNAIRMSRPPSSTPPRTRPSSPRGSASWPASCSTSSRRLPGGHFLMFGVPGRLTAVLDDLAPQ